MPWPCFSSPIETHCRRLSPALSSRPRERCRGASAAARRAGPAARLGLGSRVHVQGSRGLDRGSGGGTTSGSGSESVRVRPSPSETVRAPTVSRRFGQSRCGPLATCASERCSASALACRTPSRAYPGTSESARRTRTGTRAGVLRGRPRQTASQCTVGPRRPSHRGSSSGIAGRRAGAGGGFRVRSGRVFTVYNLNRLRAGSGRSRSRAMP